MAFNQRKRHNRSAPRFHFTLSDDVLVKGADYKIEAVVGADVVASYGGRVVLAELVAGQSTTGIIQRMDDKKAR